MYFLLDKVKNASSGASGFIRTWWGKMHKQSSLGKEIAMASSIGMKDALGSEAVQLVLKPHHSIPELEVFGLEDC